MKPRDWEHDFFPKAVETTDFWTVSLWISFAFQLALFFGGEGECPRTFEVVGHFFVLVI